MRVKVSLVVATMAAFLLVGLVGAPLIIVSATVTMFGGWGQVSLAGTLCALPIALWEFSLGVWLTVKGFRATTVTID